MITGRLSGLCAAVLAASALAARAEEGRVLTVDDCVRIGIENSAAARKARKDQEIGSALVAKARSEALPQLALNAGYTRLDELQSIDLGASGMGGAGGAAVELGSLDNYEATAGVSQLLFSGGRVRSALRAARSTRKYYDWSAEETEAALIRDIRIGCHAILFARDTVRVREGSVSNLAVHVAQAEQKHRSGTISEFDLLSARVRLANERPGLIAASNAYALAVADLRRLLAVEGRALNVAGELTYAPVEESLDELQQVAQANRATLGRMDALVRLRESDAAAAVSPSWPSLRGFFNYTESNPYGFGTGDGGWEGHWTAGLTAEWKLWDGGLTRGTVREKRLEVDKARIDLEEMTSLVALEVEDAFLAMKFAAEAVAAGGGNVEQAERALAIAGVRYGSGLGTHLEFADSAQALRAAQLSRIAALRDYMDAVARVQYACGLQDRDLYREMSSHE